MDPARSGRRIARPALAGLTPSSYAALRDGFDHTQWYAVALDDRTVPDVMTQPTHRPPASAAIDTVRVLICDDHALFRRGLLTVLEDADGIEVIAEAADGEQAVRLALELSPDVIFMDVRMPRMDGIAATRAILEAHPGAQIVVLTVSDDEDVLLEAVKAGAAGYLLKEVSAGEITSAVRAVLAGQRLVPPGLAMKLVAELAGGERRAERAAEGPKLTARELEVLKLVAQGLKNRDIALYLGISENTVKNHVRNILEKLRLHSRTQAVVYASRQNLIEMV